ncbi:hypothetical protein C6P45_001344 [Maudiozyma exigua]|uniref:Casparian strip membrane protein domain-containing protein n=1 Tax=Maudiozyma exigua TaxID=34358 RepID=A0A9P6WG20_MAUEX|nr:hypothetical protein C6P45_001344 [Kazachstania exigua]
MNISDYQKDSRKKEEEDEQEDTLKRMKKKNVSTITTASGSMNDTTTNEGTSTGTSSNNNNNNIQEVKQDNNKNKGNDMAQKQKETLPEWVKPVINNIAFDSEKERKLSHLNSYSIYPNTIPPFALDEQYQKIQSETEARDDNNNNADQMSCDNDLGKNNWTHFAHNIGSNVAYATDQKVNITLGTTSQNNRISKVGSIISNYTDSSTMSSSSLDEEEKRMIRQEILQDLNDEWGGEERLKGLYNIPMQSDFQFKTQKDRNDWAKYVARAKQIYYGKNSEKIKNSTDNQQEQLKDPLGTLSRQQSIKNKGIDWLEDFNADKEKWRKIRDKKMKKWMPKFNRVLIENQYLPLTFRIFITILSLVSLGLAVRIFQNSDANIPKIDGKIPQEPSTIMAICVNSIAVFYTIYIAADEFSGQPIGLRNPLSKLKLILLDLLFIIFSSANLALAFNTRYDQQWVCTTEYMESGLYKFPKISYICRKQKALSSFLFVLLFMWVGVFSISIIRVVEKVSSNFSRN